MNKKVNTLKVILEDEKSFKGKRFAANINGVLKKATGSNECCASICYIHFGDNFQLKSVKDAPV